VHPVERELETRSELDALIADDRATAERLQAVPMSESPVDRFLDHTDWAMPASDTHLTSAAAAAGERKLGVVAPPEGPASDGRRPRARRRQRAGVDPRRGLDPAQVEPLLAAWARGDIDTARGDIDTDQMIAATQNAAVLS
jgi:hypothetical protein